MPELVASGHRINDPNSRALAVLRIGVGIFFLIFGQYKVFGTQFILHGGFQFWINRFLEQGGAYPFMAPILRGFVLVHATPIAFLVAYGELAIGLSLTFGILVRSASVCGLTNLHAHDAFLFRLSRRNRPHVAILRRKPQPFGLRTVFCSFSGRTQRANLVSPRVARNTTSNCRGRACLPEMARPDLAGPRTRSCLYLLPAGFKTAVFRSSFAMMR
jgi:hypothetical protein